MRDEADTPGPAVGGRWAGASRATIVHGLDLHPEVLGRQEAGRPVRPFDDCGPVTQEVVFASESGDFCGGLKPVEVDVYERDAAAVLVHEYE